MQQMKYILFFLIISLKIEAQPSFEYSLINLEIKVLDNKNDVILFYKKADKLYSNLGYTVEFTKNRKINRYEKSSDESNIKIEKTPEKDIFIKQDKICMLLGRTNYDNTLFDTMVITNHKEERMIVNFIFYPFERKKYDINITIPFKKGIYEIKNPDNPQIIEKIDDN